MSKLVLRYVMLFIYSADIVYLSRFQKSLKFAILVGKKSKICDFLSVSSFNVSTDRDSVVGRRQLALRLLWTNMTSMDTMRRTLFIETFAIRRIKTHDILYIRIFSTKLVEIIQTFNIF